MSVNEVWMNVVLWWTVCRVDPALAIMADPKDKLVEDDWTKSEK